MKKCTTLIVVLFIVFTFSSCQTSTGNNIIGGVIDILQATENNGQKPTLNEFGRAFKQALNIGSGNVVEQLSAFDGFNSDSAIHIPLPEKLMEVKRVLGKIGLSSIADDLEVKLNRAAEVATKKAKNLFWQSITQMTFNDVMEIYRGPKDSATQYFKRTMSSSLGNEMRPIVQNSMAKVGAVRSYDKLMSKYQSIPFMPDVKADLTNHVVQKGMDGIFHYIAKEEAAIRENPVRHTTDLLKKVFGNRW
jgi:Protein of unknown function (DUF4197)